VYGPPGAAFLAVEPHLNWADPVGVQWGAGVDTGMAILGPSASVVYSVRLKLFVPR
jgi:hypothetical protein